MRTGRFLVPATGIVRPIAVVVGVVVALAVGGRAEAGAPLKVISSDASRLVFEVSTEGFRFVPSQYLAGTERLEIPGFGPLSGEGEPQLPGRYFMIALPPDGGYSFRHTVIRSQPLGSHRLEPAPSPVAVRDGTDFVSTREIYRIDDSVTRRSATRSVFPTPVWAGCGTSASCHSRSIRSATTRRREGR